MSKTYKDNSENFRKSRKPQNKRRHQIKDEDWMLTADGLLEEDEFEMKDFSKEENHGKN